MNMRKILFAVFVILLAASATKTKNIYASEELDFQFSSTFSGSTQPLPLPVTLSLDIIGGVPPYTVQVAFGDSSPPSTEIINKNPVPNGISYEVLHTYNSQASFTATATVTDNNGETLSDDLVLNLEDTTPSPSIHEVSGRIVNDSDTQPLKDTTVSVTSNTDSFVTLDDGRFTLLLPDNASYTLTADNGGNTPTSPPTFEVSGANKSLGDIRIASYASQVPLPRIQTLSISPVLRSITVDWSNYLSNTLTDEEQRNNLMHYKVYFKQSPFTDVSLATLITTLSTDNTTHTVSNLETERTYYFAVTAYDRFGQQYSTEINTGSLFLETPVIPTLNEWGIILLSTLTILIFKKNYYIVTQ